MTPDRKFVEVPEPLVAGWYLASFQDWERHPRTEIVFVKLGADGLKVKRMSHLTGAWPSLFTFLARIEAPELEI